MYKKVCKKCGRQFWGKGPTSALCDECFDLTGKKIGLWEVVERAPDKGGRDYWLCRCTCGKEKSVNGYNLRTEKTLSCGCVAVDRLKEQHRQSDPDLTGLFFGQLKVKEPCGSDKRGQKLWLCECSCGGTIKATTSNLRRGAIVSCGHIKRTQASDIADYGTNPASIASSRISPRNKSGVKGVWYDKTRKKWTAEIMFQRKKYWLGRFDEKEDAVKARIDAEERLHNGFLEWYKENYPEKWEKIEKDNR